MHVSRTHKHTEAYAYTHCACPRVTHYVGLGQQLLTARGHRWRGRTRCYAAMWRSFGTPCGTRCGPSAHAMRSGCLPTDRRDRCVRPRRCATASRTACGGPCSRCACRRPSARPDPPPRSPAASCRPPTPVRPRRGRDRVSTDAQSQSKSKRAWSGQRSHCCARRWRGPIGTRPLSRLRMRGWRRTTHAWCGTPSGRARPRGSLVISCRVCVCVCADQQEPCMGPAVGAAEGDGAQQPAAGGRRQRSAAGRGIRRVSIHLDLAVRLVHASHPHLRPGACACACTQRT
jgi:hypothetical protein